MNITRENTGELTATLKIEITQPDYEEKVNKVLRDYQHKANIPGFRPGKVPVGMIRKMYGKAILADEINTLISESLASYIKDENIEVLGNPLPNQEKNAGVNFELQDSFEFYFDLGFAPKIDFTLSDAIKVDRYLIKVDDEMVERYFEDSRRRFGKSIHPEVSGEEDMLSGELIEIDAEGRPVEGSAGKETMLNISKLEKEESKKSVTGLAKGTRIVIKPLEFFKDADDAAKSLTLPKEKVEHEATAFEFTIKDIFHIDPADLDEEFFDKIYPGKDIETEEQFRDFIRKDAAASFVGETDKLFFNQVTKKLIEEINLPLPDEFLKRWLLENREAKISVEDIDREYVHFAESTKWQLIENKVLMDNKVVVMEEEVRNYIKSYFLNQIPLPMDDPEADKRYDSLVDTVMKNEEQVRKIYNELYSAKLLDLFKNNLSITDHEVTYEEFVNLASAAYMHDHDHDHEHEHEHEHTHEHEDEHQHEHKK